MHIAHCDYPATGGAILDILNEEIVHTTALYDYEPRSLADMAVWFEIKERNAYPVIGAFEGDALLGFASYGAFRNWPAYKYTVEHSVYVHRAHRGKGVGATLLERLIEEARGQEYHVMVGAIDATNQASRSLHESWASCTPARSARRASSLAAGSILPSIRGLSTRRRRPSTVEAGRGHSPSGGRRMLLSPARRHFHPLHPRRIPCHMQHGV